MRYSLNSGGKRIRPMLVLEFCKMFGGGFDDAIDIAASIEMIHTYSLIHDDLPSMDNDDMRRGKPSNHVEFSEGTAILAGDGLLNYAYENMIDKAIKSTDARKYLKAMQIVSEYAGSRGMILGQTADIMTEGKKIDLDTADYINTNKTGKLITASMMAGAIIGGATDEEVDKVRNIGYNMGIAFQILDDILDITGNADELGKPVGSDIRNDKTTYPMIVGIEQCEERLEELYKDAISELKSLEKDSDFVREIFNFIVKRDR
jgi:geranylgeranyl diphosphate synthase type II